MLNFGPSPPRTAVQQQTVAAPPSLGVHVTEPGWKGRNMDIFQTLGTYTIIVSVVLPCVGLLILYSVIRVAVARGLRDHQVWMEKYRPAGARDVLDPKPIVNYSAI